MNFGLYNMEQPYFSIIIPTYNSTQTLQTCLNSIIVQSFQNFEIIIIDGYSTDSTLEIIKINASLLTSQFKWCSEMDKGIYDAMNKGIKKATGKWLYFLGSDDILNNSLVLQKVFDINKSKHNVVYGNVKIVGDTTWASNGDIYDKCFDLLKLLQKNICHQAIFYNKECFTDNASIYNVEYKLCADWDLNFRFWAIKPFLFIDIMVADFYSGGTTTKTNIDESFSRDFNKNLNHYFSIKNVSNYFVVQKYFFLRIKYLKIQSFKNLVKKLIRRG